MTTADLDALVLRANRAGHNSIAEYALELEGALQECARLSGADLSEGFPTWPSLPVFVVEEVRQLRADYDDALGR